MYDIENYYNAETIKEAVTLLKEHPEARIISGGQRRPDQDPGRKTGGDVTGMYPGHQRT